MGVTMYIPDSDADLQMHKEIVEVLETFVSKLPAIDFASVVSLEGLPISSWPPKLPGDLDDVRIAAMTAAILSLGERAVMETGKGEMTRLIPHRVSFSVLCSNGHSRILGLNLIFGRRLTNSKFSLHIPHSAFRNS